MLSIGSRRSSLSEFQAVGPAIANARRPHDRVHRVLDKSLKVLEFWRKKFEKSLNLNVPYFEIFAFLNFEESILVKFGISPLLGYSSLAYLKKLPNVYYI